MTLVTGTGRCGTGWCAEALRAFGVRAGHQDVLRHEHVLGRTPVHWRDYEVEVSYEAAPLARRMCGRRVVLVVRHPLDVARSWVSLGAFDDASGFDDLHESIRRHCPAVLDHADPVARALVFWYEWNMLVWPHADAVALIEDLYPYDLLRYCGLAERFDGEESDLPAPPPRDTNSRPWQRRPTERPRWADVPASHAARLSTFARHLGYSLRDVA